MSVSFTSTIRLEHINVSRYTKELEASLKKVMYEAARQFAIHTLARIPVDTGFLRGAFLNLEYLLGSATGNTETVTRTNQSGKKIKKPRKGNKYFNKKKIEKGKTTYQRFRPSKGAAKVDRINSIRRMERRRLRLLNRIEKEQNNPNAKLKFSSKKEERQHYYAELEARRAELKALHDHYAKTRTAASLKAYLTALKSDRYKLLKLSKLQQRYYISNLQQAKFNRARRSAIRIAAYNKIIDDLNKRLIKEYKRLGRTEGVTGFSQIKPGTTGSRQREFEYRKKLGQIVPQLNVVKNKVYYHYRPTRTNVNPLKAPGFNKPRYYKHNGIKYLKHPIQGRQFGTPLREIFTFGRNVAGPLAGLNLLSSHNTAVNVYGDEIVIPVIRFNYEVLIKYLHHNDIKYGWQSWAAGMAAFNATILRLLSTLPKVEDFLYQTESQHGQERSEGQVRASFLFRHREKR